MHSDTGFPEIYSAVLLPPLPVIQEINLIKRQLADKIGAYKGLHAHAHITLCTFKATDINLPLWKTHVLDFARHQAVFPLTFDRIACFSNGAFVLLPDENSHEQLHRVMKSFYKNRPKGRNNTSQRAHISIARGLNQEQQNLAQSIIATATISFSCNTIAIRKYNHATGLFELKEQYALGDLHADQQA